VVILLTSRLDGFVPCAEFQCLKMAVRLRKNSPEGSLPRTSCHVTLLKMAFLVQAGSVNIAAPAEIGSPGIPKKVPGAAAEHRLLGSLNGSFVTRAQGISRHCKLCIVRIRTILVSVEEMALWRLMHTA
jgi:hypothetical protein